MGSTSGTSGGSGGSSGGVGSIVNNAPEERSRPAPDLQPNVRRQRRLRRGLLLVTTFSMV